MASWSVCSMVAEPPALLAAFAAHYLDLGASEVHLFLDAPDYRSVELLSAMDGVRVTPCTPDFWKDINGVRITPRGEVPKRPPGQEVRQLRCANRAYATCETDWFFFCDADEFLVARQPVGELLDRQPEAVRFCRPHMAERIFGAARPQSGLFDGRIRRQLPPDPALKRRIYGDLAPMIMRGLTGHTMGKSFVRSGQSDLQICIHRPAPRDPAEEARLRTVGKMGPGPYLDDSWLVHFDGLTPLHWKLKLLRFYLSRAAQAGPGRQPDFGSRTPARVQQLVTLHKNRGNPEALERMMGVIRLEPEVLARLEAADGLLDIACDPAGAARRRAGPDLRFSAAEFDAALRQRHGALIAEHGLEA